MLVFLSDLHLTDGSSGTTIYPRAFCKLSLCKNNQLIMQLREIDNVRAPPGYARLDPGGVPLFSRFREPGPSILCQNLQGTFFACTTRYSAASSGCEEPHYFRWR